MIRNNTTIDIQYRDTNSPVVIGRGILSELGNVIQEMASSIDVAIVADAAVNALYGKALRDSLTSAGLNIHQLNLDINNAEKLLVTVERIYQFFDDIRADWSFSIILLGGNVLIDSAGFAAVTFHRGLHYFVVPTTLLSQVDGAIGGALGVHFNHKTNYIGARVLPELVWCDVDLLETLSLAERRAGMAEIIKQAVVADRNMFAWLETIPSTVLNDISILHTLVQKTVEVKARLVETGGDQFLNFGHTIGHALENLMEHNGIRHGEAVAIGMYGEASLAEASGHLPSGSTKQLEKLLSKFGLPTRFPVAAVQKFATAEVFCEYMWGMVWRDKKVFNHELQWVTPIEVFGKAGRINLSKNQIIREFRRLCEFSSSRGDL